MSEKSKFQFKFGAAKDTNKEQNTKEQNVEEEEVNKEEIHTEAAEGEKVLFRHLLKSYLWDGAQWQERGEGDLIVTRSEKFGRVLLARLGTGKIAVNFLISKECTLGTVKSKDFIVSCTGLDYSDQEPQSRLFAFRFKEKEQSEEFKKLIIEEGKYWAEKDQKVEQKEEKKE